MGDCERENCLMMKSSIMKPTINLTEPLKVPLSLWDTLPTEIINEINDYNKLPYLDEIQEFVLERHPDWEKKCEWKCNVYLEARVRRQTHIALWGDVWLKNEYNSPSMYVARPDRTGVIYVMKQNKLRVRKGMKTRTMLTQLIKL